MKSDQKVSSYIFPFSRRPLAISSLFYLFLYSFLVTNPLFSADHHQNELLQKNPRKTVSEKISEQPPCGIKRKIGTASLLQNKDLRGHQGLSGRKGPKDLKENLAHSGLLDL